MKNCATLTLHTNTKNSYIQTCEAETYKHYMKYLDLLTQKKGQNIMYIARNLLICISINKYVLE